MTDAVDVRCRTRRHRLRSVLVVVALSAGCDRSAARVVNNDELLRDRVASVVPAGTDGGDVRVRMQSKGFACAYHRGADVDTLARDSLQPPLDRFTCVKDEPAPETSDGFRRHFVDILLVRGAVGRIEARSRINRATPR